MANGERLRNTVGRINAIMCEASSNCLRPIIPYGTTLLWGENFTRASMGMRGTDHYQFAFVNPRACTSCQVE